MAKVIVVATSRKTRGGITSVVKAHETGPQWNQYHCKWIETHRDGSKLRKIAYFLIGIIKFCCLIPFYDLVHIHSAGDVSAKRKIIFARICHLLKKRIIVHFHPAGPSAVWERMSQEYVRELFGYADEIIVLSPQWIKWINEAFPGNHYKMEVLWNPCPHVNRRDDMRRKVVLYAATVNKRKGYDVLIRAFANVSVKYPEWYLFIAGNGEIDEGKVLAKELMVEDKVKWLGWVKGKEKEELFQKASIYCLPSTGEGFPMGVLDAWAYGVPCITTPVGGIPDIIKDGFNGLLFPVGDIKALTNQLIKLISNDQLRAEIVKESDKWVCGDFSVDVINARLGNIYKSLLEGD